MKRKKKIFRNNLLISQQDLAHFLGLSLSQVAMWECGQRSLPGEALIKLSQLEIDWEESKKSKQPGKSLTELLQKITEQDEQKAKKMLRKVLMHPIRIQKFEKQLSELNEKQQSQLNWLNLVDWRLDSLPRDKSNEGDRLWLQIQQMESSRRIQKLNQEIRKLQLSIDLLKAEVEIHERHFGHLGSV